MESWEIVPKEELEETWKGCRYGPNAESRSTLNDLILKVGSCYWVGKGSQFLLCSLGLMRVTKKKKLRLTEKGKRYLYQVFKEQSNELSKIRKEKRPIPSIVKVATEFSTEGDTVISISMFDNGFKLLKRLQGGNLICCFEINGEYREEIDEPEVFYKGL